MKRYLKLYLKLIAMGVKIDLEYRFNFVMGLLVEVGWLGTLILFYKVVFLNTRALSGWSYGEALVFLGVVQTFSEIFGSVFMNFNLRRLYSYVQKGTLDLFLLKPANSQLLVSTYYPYVRGLLTVMVGIILIILGFKNLGTVPSVLSIAGSVGLMGCGILIAYALAFSSLMVVFWTNKAFNASMVSESLINVSNYPTDFFSGAIKMAFTFIVPLALMTTFPAKALLGEMVWWWLPLGLALAAFGLFVSHKLWHFALRHYSSASS